jgi:hypothetical protein
MPTSHGAVLSSIDLPLAELSAARLDGELFAINDCFIPIDTPAGSEHRALSVLHGQPERVIAERRTAAWIWGAIETPCWPHELCVGSAARVRSSGSGWASIREVVIQPGDIAVIAGVQVTTPLRTVVDLARFAEPFGTQEVRMIRWFVSNSWVGIDECLRAVAGRRNLPNKRRAITRLQLCFSHC